jgi:hypothetical protein
MIKMSERTLQVNISRDKFPSTPDRLLSDVLTISPLSPINVRPGHPTQVNLCIHNNSSSGRMARVSANYDVSKGIIVQIPEQHIYVQPQGDTVISALIEARLDSDGTSNINFKVH